MSTGPTPDALPPARLLTRLLCALYEGLILAGTLVVAGFVLVPVSHRLGLDADEFRRFTRTWMMAVVSAYFLWFWLHGGQTLPMKTWRIRLCRTDGRPLPARQAMLRVVLVWLQVAALAAATTVATRFPLPGSLVAEGAAAPPALSAWLAGSCAVFLVAAWWLLAVFDRDHQFLHDRLAGSRVVRLD